MRKAGVIGIGQNMSGEDFNDAFDDLYQILSQWQRKRWLVWNLTTVSKVSTGAQSYTVGAGGDYNIARPDRIESAFVRQLLTSSPNQVDNPLCILQSREDYNRITLKRLTSLPFCIFYDSGFPLGRIYPWPIAQANIYEVHISIKTPLQLLTNLAETLLMPPEYMPGLIFLLAQRLRQAYQLPKDDQLDRMVKDALATIREANTQIPVLQMPQDVMPNGGVYNIFSDYPN